MGMTGKDGKWYANPHVARMHDGAAEEERGSDGGEMGGIHAKTVIIHKTSDGKHHVVAMHDHGVEHTEHESKDDAMDKADEHMSGDGDEENDAEDAGGMEDAMQPMER